MLCYHTRLPQAGAVKGKCSLCKRRKEACLTSAWVTPTALSSQSGMKTVCFRSEESLRHESWHMNAIKASRDTKLTRANRPSISTERSLLSEMTHLCMRWDNLKFLLSYRNLMWRPLISNEAKEPRSCKKWEHSLRLSYLVRRDVRATRTAWLLVQAPKTCTQLKASTSIASNKTFSRKSNSRTGCKEIAWKTPWNSAKKKRRIC